MTIVGDEGDRAAERVTVQSAAATDGATVVQVAGSLIVIDSMWAARWARRPRKRGDCPYPGLVAFSPDRAEWFFGRETRTGDLVEKVDAVLASGTGGPVIVVGPSGVGKSSLLGAGLLTSLRAGDLAVPGSGNWPPVFITPGPAPLAKLREALAKCAERAATAGRTVVVVDQLEEIFTLCEGEDQRTGFLAELEKLASGEGRNGSGPAAVVVLGLRVDFYEQATRYPVLAAALQNRQFLLGPMTPGEVRDAIVKPAQDAGLDLENGLAERLLRDLNVDEANGYEPGRLPLLAHALRVTWQRSKGGPLTIEAYQQTGGIRGAIAQTAKEEYESLDDAGRRTARRVFLSLVRVGEVTGDADSEGAKDVRRRSTVKDLRDQADDWAVTSEVLDRFTKARLLTRGERTVEITHEALLSEWQELRGWIDTDRANALSRQKIGEDAASWVKESRSDSWLYRDVRLASALEWARTDPDRPRDPNSEVNQFLKASEDLSKASQRRRQQTIRNLTVLSSSLIVLIVFALAATGFAFGQRSTAQDNEGSAQSEEMGAEALDLFPTNAPLAMLLSLQAYERGPTRQAMDAMAWAASEPLEYFLSEDGGSERVAFSPGGGLLAIGSDNGTVKLFDAAAGRPTRSLTEQSAIYSLTFSPRGDTLAVGEEDGSVVMVNAATGEQTGNLTESSAIYSLAFSPDGGTLAVGAGNGTVALWDTATDRPTHTLTEPNTSGIDVNSVTFSPDGRTLAIGFRNLVGLWNTVTDRPTATLIEAGTVDSMAYSPDGATLAVGDNDGTVGLWDTATNRRIHTLTEESSVDSVAYSPDGATLAVGEEDGTVATWDIAADLPSTTLPEGSSPVNSVAFSPNGQTLAVGSEAGTGIWDAATGNLPGDSGVGSVAFSPNGQTLAAGSADGGVALWDTSTGKLVLSLPDGSAAQSVAFSADGKTLAVGKVNGTVNLWNTATGQQTGTLSVTNAPVNGVAYSPVGSTLAVAAGDGSVSLWDTATGQRLKTAVIANQVFSVAFGPGGRTLAAAGSGGVDAWNLTNNKLILSLGTGSDAVSVAFSPDGKTLAVGLGDGTVELLDVATGRTTASFSDGSGIMSVAFSPDGQTLAVGDGDGDLTLWSTATGQTIAELSESSAVNTLAFSPDGKQLAIAQRDNVELIAQDFINLPADDMEKLICGEVRQNMTPPEWTIDASGNYQKTCPILP
jgi:WD40 repeat protein